MGKRQFYFTMLILVILLFSIVSCARTASTPTSNLEDTRWTLESYGEPGNLQAVLEGTEITATFESAKGQVRGSAGCNTYFADYEINDNKLSILQMAYTEIGCLEPEGILEQEQEYLQTLLAAESFQLRNEKLQIDCGDHILLYISK